METVAANLGSMLTPVGNPQNLYLYARYGIGAGEFFAVTAPVWAAGLLLTVLAVGLSRLPRTPVPYLPASGPISRRTALFYGAVFLLSLLAVFRLLPWWLVLGATVAAVAVADRRLFRSIDYSLFATFVFFFILVGNLGSLPVVRDILSRLLAGRELPVSILASQAVSNGSRRDEDETRHRPAGLPVLHDRVRAGLHRLRQLRHCLPRHEGQQGPGHEAAGDPAA